MSTESVRIVAIEYHEPEWEETKKAIKACHVPVTWVDRDGTGSMAAAYNHGFAAEIGDEEYVWFMSNPVFNPKILHRLVGALKVSPMTAAVHPAFHSDHAFCRPSGRDEVTDVPFLEFTCPLVRAKVFYEHRLDERMPYWGHDLDWGYRIKKAGYSLSVHHGTLVQHVYVRNSRKYGVTAQRAMLRKMTDISTTNVLVDKYGSDWAHTLKRHG